MGRPRIPEEQLTHEQRLKRGQYERRKERLKKAKEECEDIRSSGDSSFKTSISLIPENKGITINEETIDDREPILKMEPLKPTKTKLTQRDHKETKVPIAVVSKLSYLYLVAALVLIAATLFYHAKAYIGMGISEFESWAVAGILDFSMVLLTLCEATSRGLKRLVPFILYVVLFVFTLSLVSFDAMRETSREKVTASNTRDVLIKKELIEELNKAYLTNSREGRITKAGEIDEKIEREESALKKMQNSRDLVFVSDSLDYKKWLLIIMRAILMITSAFFLHRAIESISPSKATPIS